MNDDFETENHETYNSGSDSSESNTDPKKSDNKKETSKKRKIIVAALAGILVLLLGFISWQYLKPPAKDNVTFDAIKVAPSAEPTITPSAPPKLNCTTVPPAGMSNPKKFSVVRTGQTTHMIGLGSEGEGKNRVPKAPGNNDGESVSWWTDGPLVGSRVGNSILTVHSFRNGGALGNDFKEGNTALRKGDLIKITDGSGQVACYKLDKIIKVPIADYEKDPKKFDPVYDPTTTDPHIVLVTCTDYNWIGHYSASRVLFYGKLV